jgi:hypothetical protein
MEKQPRKKIRPRLARLEHDVPLTQDLPSALEVTIKSQPGTKQISDKMAKQLVLPCLNEYNTLVLPCFCF